MITICSADLARAANLLQSGQLVAIPTETVYGMAANAFDEKAVKSIFKVKNRPFYDPLILHTSGIERMSDWGIEVPQLLSALAEAFWPGPLTLLLLKSQRIGDLVTAGLPRVAFRIPEHSLTRELLKQLDYPLAAPSANPFGKVSPTRPEHVLKYFDRKIPMVLDGGPCQVGIESTIVGLESERVVVYRLGGLPIEEIEKLCGNVEVRQSSSRPEAPGMLDRHYSPDQKIIAIDTQNELDALESPDVAYILFDLRPPKTKKDRLIKLSTKASLKDAAQSFYAALHNWETDPRVKTLVIQRLPNFDLGRAINDRLSRAMG